MQDEAPGVGSTLIPIVTFFGIGLILGLISAWNAPREYKNYIVVAVSTIFLFIGWGLAGWIQKKRLKFHYYEYENSLRSLPMINTNQEKGDTVVVHIPELNRRIRLRCGISMEDWQTLAREMNQRGKYTVRALQDIFGHGPGYAIYNRITEPLKNAGVLIDSRNGGVEITDHIGRHFFAQLEKEDYEVLRMTEQHPPASIA